MALAAALPDSRWRGGAMWWSYLKDGLWGNIPVARVQTQLICRGQVMAEGDGARGRLTAAAICVRSLWNVRTLNGIHVFFPLTGRVDLFRCIFDSPGSALSEDLGFYISDATLNVPALSARLFSVASRIELGTTNWTNRASIDNIWVL